MKVIMESMGSLGHSRIAKILHGLPRWRKPHEDGDMGKQRFCIFYFLLLTVNS